MDFSSSNVPISRDTWAPVSPPPSDAPRGGRDAPSDTYAERPPPPRDDDRDGRGDGNGYGGRGGGGYGGERRNFAPPPPRRPGNAPAPEPNPVLGVFGLSIRTRERDLEDEFMRYGDVDKVTIVYDQRTDRSRGFGFITMRSVEDAGRCIEKLNGIMLHGRAIRVDYSATQKPHAPTPGEYKGEKRPLDDRYNGGGRYDRYDDRRGGRGGYDDRGYGRDRYDDRDRYRDRDSYGGSSRRDEDPYGGRSRRDDDRRRSPSPRRSRYSASPERRPLPPSRDYDEPADSASRS